jgi:hypothetical protein
MRASYSCRAFDTTILRTDLTCHSPRRLRTAVILSLPVAGRCLEGYLAAHCAARVAVLGGAVEFSSRSHVWVLCPQIHRLMTVQNHDKPCICSPG